MSSFNWIKYLYLNQDLIDSGINNEQKARAHFDILGQKEGRIYEYEIPDGFDIEFYKQIHPYLSQMPDDGVYAHYTVYGKKAGSLYSRSQLVHSISNNLEIYNITSNKNIFFFSPHTPEFDSSSGGYRLLQMLTILRRSLGYNVYFFCNASRGEDHLTLLEDMGIKVFVTDTENQKYTTTFAKELRDQGINPDYIFIAWIDMAKQVMSFLKHEFPRVKIVVDSVDVHWAREQRKLKLYNQEETKEFLFNKELEKSIYRAANVVLCVTENDKAEIMKEMPKDDINIKIVSNIYPESYLDKEKKINNNDIIFVGGFSHGPNVDAAIWSCEIYKKFIDKYAYVLDKKPKLYIVGAGPPQEVIDMHDGINIIVTGYVKDLSPFYKKARVSISPLSWGAGIKGKVCEAAYKNTCILTTDIGNEGINLVDGREALIVNTTEEFVDSLRHIYAMSNDMLEKIQSNAMIRIHNLTSVDSNTKVIQSILETKKIIVCVVTYNQSALLKKCIESIVNNTTYPNYKIVVVDNASTDSTQEIMMEITNKYSGLVDYRRNDVNEFFIKPNNDIIEEFSDADVVLVNHDIEILSRCWLTRLYSSVYSSANIGCAGGKTVYPNGMLAEAGAEIYRDGTGRNIGRYEDPNTDVYNLQRYVGYVSGCLMYMRRDAIDQVGILDKDLEPMYYEDSEWQYRLHINGIKSIYEPRCVAIHAEGSSSGTDINKGMKRYQEINRKKFIQKYQNYNIEQYNECSILAHMRNE